MPSKTVSSNLNNRHYFVTCTTQHWYYIFDRQNRWKILADSLNYCIKNKELKIYAYVLMLNHLHLIIQSPDVAGFLRDFKKYTAQEIIKSMTKSEPKIAKLFRLDSGNYQIWQKTNMPILLESESVFQQKVQYIEHNPVRKSYVEQPKCWHYSSANPHSPIKCSSL